MSLIRFGLLAVLLLQLSACALEPSSNRYQLPAGQTRPGQGAVDELQHRARQALDRRAYAQAVEYLQRAIRIEPRNPLSWHYLARTYRSSGDYARCVEMAQRSFSYSSGDDNLDAANRQLTETCQQGY